jgi:hypothetical protein
MNSCTLLHGSHTKRKRLRASPMIPSGRYSNPPRSAAPGTCKLSLIFVRRWSPLCSCCGTSADFEFCVARLWSQGFPKKDIGPAQQYHSASWPVVALGFREGSLNEKKRMGAGEASPVEALSLAFNSSSVNVVNPQPVWLRSSISVVPRTRVETTSPPRTTTVLSMERH